jgi:glycosyltransferase involved in cell wall biosynthesis
MIVTNLFPPGPTGGYELECEVVVAELAPRFDVRVVTSGDGSVDEVHGATIVRRLPISGHDARDALAAPWRARMGAKVMREELAAFAPDLVWIWNGAAIPQTAVRIAETSGAPVAWRVCQHWFDRLYTADLFLRHLTEGDRGLRRLWGAGMRAINKLPPLRIELDSAVPAAISWNSNALRDATTVRPTVLPRFERVVHPATPNAALLAGIERRPAAEPLVAYLARLERPKGAHIAITALARLEQEHGVQAQLVLAGQGRRDDVRALERLAEDEGVRARLHLPGPLHGDALVDLFARAHVVVIPTVWHEAFGLVAVEAATAGVPIVAARNGGLAEILREDVDALLFTSNDADACADAIARTLRDPEAARQRVESARLRAREFSIDHYLESTRAFVDEVVYAASSA